jgi:hypothetical protein
MLIDLPDGWQLVQYYQRPRSLWWVWHEHDPVKYEGGNNVCMPYKQGGACTHCGEDMPDAVGGFIKLIEWER